MRGFSEYNPLAAAIYFLCVMLTAMFTVNPFIAAASLAGGAGLHILLGNAGGARMHGFCAVLFFVMTAANPLFYHNGKTVLFIMNDKPITLEALLYGAVSAAVIIAMLYWARIFSQIMTGDRLLCLFGRLAPGISLILSVSLRYIPLFMRRAAEIKRMQKALGLYGEYTQIERMKASMRVFSIMTTWALENGIITADSMAARGYGIGRRTSFSLFRFDRRDALLTALSLLLSGMVGTGIFFGALDIVYYPSVELHGQSLLSAVSYAAYGLLALLPVLIEAEGRIRWKYLLSKI